jgi:hypothetical protein
MYTDRVRKAIYNHASYGISQRKEKKGGITLTDNRHVHKTFAQGVVQRQPLTRSEYNANAAVAASQGLDFSNVIEGNRATREPDRLGSAPHNYQDRHGNTHFNPGSSVLASIRMRLSGNSLTDIAHLVATTGRGGHGSNEVWHHMSDYDPTTGEGTVVLMPSAIHAAHHHIGGSALARATMHDDPDRMARYGQHH